MAGVLEKQPVDVQAFVDRQPLRRLTLRTIVLCALIMFIDGFDIYVIGQIAPLIAADLGEPVENLTQVFLLQQIGLSIGAFVISPLPDRFGRKPVLIVCSLVFGAVTLLSTGASSLWELAVLRAAAGVFLAAVIPKATALISEITPPRYRSSFIAVAFCGYVLGTLAAALCVVFLVDRFGWRSCLVLGGVMPLLFVPLCWHLLRESVQFQARRDPLDPAIGRTLKALDPDFELHEGQRYVVVEEERRQGAKPGLREIFDATRAPTTALLWAGYFTIFCSVSLLAAWGPTFFNQLKGVSVAHYAAMSIYLYVGGLIGTASVGFLMDRIGAGRVVVTLSLATAATIVAIGMIPFGTAAFALAFFLSGYCQTATQAGLNALCAQAYPSRIRSTGIGWAFGLARIGGIVGPLLGGIAISLTLGLATIYKLTALMPLVVAILLFALQRRLVPR